MTRGVRHQFLRDGEDQPVVVAGRLLIDLRRDGNSRALGPATGEIFQGGAKAGVIENVRM